MASAMTQVPLADILIRRRLLSGEQLESLYQEARGGEYQLQQLIATRHLVPESALAEARAEQYGLPYESLIDARIDLNQFPQISTDLMRRHNVVPLRCDDESVTIAIPDPQDLPTLDMLERLVPQAMRLVVSAPQAIADLLSRSTSNSQAVVRVTEEFRPLLVQENEQGEEVLSVEKIGQDQSPVIRLVDTIVLNALQKRASDIHIEPGDRVTEVKYRVDGILYPAMEPVDIRFHNAIVSRIKVMSELDIAERRVPQDGRFKLRLEGRTIDFRVSILPSAFSESVVIRILAKEEFASSKRGLHLDALGLKRQDLQRFRRAITASYGMVLVTGPTGSGKTTTLYAAINEVNTSEDKFITIEDPVEYQLKGVIQIPVNEKKGLTFARGLRSILRHDPDKIMIGEIRDAETAQIAIQSALTGHLVFTTVHANNTFDVFGRFVNMGIEPYNFVSSLNCIMAQRLVRTLCVACKRPARVSEEECHELGFEYALISEGQVCEPVGCIECHGLGYRGRQAVTEFLPVTERIKELILDRRPASDLRKAAEAEGMTTLRQSGIERVQAGQTTMREVNRVSFLG